MGKAVLVITLTNVTGGAETSQKLAKAKQGLDSVLQMPPSLQSTIKLKNATANDTAAGNRLRRLFAGRRLAASNVQVVYSVANLGASTVSPSQVAVVGRTMVLSSEKRTKNALGSLGAIDTHAGVVTSTKMSTVVGRARRQNGASLGGSLSPSPSPSPSPGPSPGGGTDVTTTVEQGMADGAIRAVITSHSLLAAAG